MGPKSLQVAKSVSTVFQPLGPKQTRRVWINHHPGSNILYFELEVISIDADPVGESSTEDVKYVAVSYTWGTLNTIGVAVKSINDEFFPVYVTKSLLVFCEYALRVLGQRVAFWIDQLCINQTDHDEKVSQIHMMREIYEASTYVLIWLGPPDHSSSTAMQRIRGIRLKFSELAAAKAGYEADDGRIVPEYLPVLTGPDTEENYQDWRGILALLDRPWFSRIWIIQEATSKRVFSDQTHVLCGEDLIFFDDFMRLWRVIANIRPWYWNSKFTDFAIKAGHHDHFAFNLIGSFWMDRQMYSMFPLLELLRGARGFGATDLHDKLYAMATFATDTKSAANPLDIDYRKTVSQAYIDFVIWYIREYQNLDFLGSIHKATEKVKDVQDQLPDWVPDWREHRSRALYDYYQQSQREQHRIPMYHACGRDNVNNLAIAGDVGDTSSMRALTVLGVRLTTVKPWVPRIEDCDKFGVAVMKNMCPLNHVPLGHVLSRTMCNDISGILIERRPAKKRGAWYKPYQLCANGHKDCFLSFEGVPGLAREPEHSYGDKDFFMLQPTEGPDHGVIGLGEEGIQEKDEIWMIDGGKMLYILRPWSLPDEYRIRTLDISGGVNSPDAQLFAKDTTMYQLIGESFVLGLMDGEILDMLGDEPKHTRPACLAHMDNEFRKINIISPSTLYFSGRKDQYDPADLLDTENEMHLVDIRLGFASKQGSSMRQYADKKRYWTPEVVEEMDRGDEETIPHSRPSDDCPAFLTCDTD